MYGNELFKMPIPIGGYVYDKNFPMFPQTVMGYRIGRMMGEAQEEYEDGGYKDGAWYIQLTGRIGEASAPVTEIGASLFRTRKEAMQAAAGGSKDEEEQAD